MTVLDDSLDPSWRILIKPAYLFVESALYNCESHFENSDEWYYTVSKTRQLLTQITFL